MRLSSFRIAEPDRRARLLLLSALACALLTLFGAAGELLGMERYLKVNTVKRRTYSLFRQGCLYYRAISKSERKICTRSGWRKNCSRVGDAGAAGATTGEEDRTRARSAVSMGLQAT